MVVSEYLHNIYYDIFNGYPVFIFDEIISTTQKIISYTSINKVKYDKKNKILFFIENKNSYLYMPLNEVGNIKFIDDILKINTDTVIVSSKKNLNDWIDNDIMNLEINETLTGKKVPFEIFSPN